MYRVAVVGTGFIGGYFENTDDDIIYSHSKAYWKHPEFRLVASCDIDKSKSDVVCSKFGGTSYESDINKILEIESPEVISLCTPDDTHFAILERILKSDNSVKIIFAEKPICRTPKELKFLLQKVKESSIPIIVNHTRRFDSAHQRIARLIHSRELGEWLRVSVDYYGGWNHMGVHVVDILQYFSQMKFHAENVNYCCESNYSDDPTLNIKGRLGDSIDLEMKGLDENFYQILDMNLIFENGQIKINDFGQEISVYRKTINEARENILVKDKVLSGVGMVNPIMNAIDIIAKYLKTRNVNILEQFGLSEAEKTMESIWNVRLDR